MKITAPPHLRQVAHRLHTLSGPGSLWPAQDRRSNARPTRRRLELLSGARFKPIFDWNRTRVVCWRKAEQRRFESISKRSQTDRSGDLAASYNVSCCNLGLESNFVDVCTYMVCIYIYYTYTYCTYIHIHWPDKSYAS